VRKVLEHHLGQAAEPKPAPVALKPGDKVRLLPGACKNASIHIIIKDGDIGEVTDKPCNPISKVVRIGDDTWFICTADLELVAPAPPDTEAVAMSPDESLRMECSDLGRAGRLLNEAGDCLAKYDRLRAAQDARLGEAKP
jgi:hypothetical protein